jgi:hypothetical protein
LAIVGFLQMVTMVWQAILLRQTRGDVHAQAEWIKTQAEHMGTQTGILTDSVAAAKASAEATKKSIDLAVEKERTRIFVEVDPLDFKESQPIYLGYWVQFRVIFHGSTFAFIEEAVAEAEYGDSPIPKDGGAAFILGSIDIPKVISPGMETRDCTARFWQHLDSFEFERLNHGQTFVHFRGRIKYKDFSGTERETAFCFTWKPRPLGMAIGWPHWEKSGPPEANRET